MLVTRLCEGQHATVLQLPASPHSVKDEAERKHAAVVSLDNHGGSEGVSAHVRAAQQ